jgi:GFO/IDH/MocA oxidoreductase family protein
VFFPIERDRPRVLVVGAGRRVQNNFLPALRCLAESFDVIGVHSRTYERLLPVAETWNVAAIRSLDDVDFSAVDIVAMSLPVSQNPIVLRRLLPNAARLQVLIDTPIIASLGELKAAERLLGQFKNVVVTEDYMNFPPFALVRKAVDEGLVGTARSLTLNNTGYLYHGLALIRSFDAFKTYRSSWRKKISRGATAVGYTFPSGFSASVIGPYRQHTAGGLFLEGSSGSITEFPSDEKLKPGENGPYHVLSAIREENELTGYRLSAGDRDPYLLDLPNLRAMRTMPFADKSDLNLLRGCGLISVFDAFRDQRNINHRYGFRNAFYDSVMSRVSQGGRLPFDPFSLFGSDVVTALRFCLARTPLAPERAAFA